MRNLVSSNPWIVLDSGVTAQDYMQHLGMLTGPFQMYNPRRAVDRDSVWAADNGCFSAYHLERIELMLRVYINFELIFCPC
jgi:hypothetical protein